jgi:hypothetical protein
MLVAAMALVALGLLGWVLDHGHGEADLAIAFKGQFDWKAVAGFQGILNPKNHQM